VTAPDPAPMAPFPHPHIPDDAYRRMTLVLRVGLLTSLVILLVALGAYLAVHPGQMSGPAISSNPIVQYFNLGALGQGLASGAPEAYLALGMFALIATPILRVATGVYYFRRGHETTIAAVTFVVLVLLLLGVLVIGPWLR
jgi:uncharacterized membrane protein